jgi:predicted amidophosphoribosyltransferase
MILKDISPKYSGVVDGTYHIAHYHPKSQSHHDITSSHLLDFKDNIAPWVSRWSNMSARFMAKEINADIIIRVLSSGETEASSSSSLDFLGKKMEEAIAQAQYLPMSLKKSRSTKPLKTLRTRKERENELAGVYSFIPPNNVGSNIKTILILDDIVTSGTTLREISRAIKSASPSSKLVFFALGQTYDSWASNDPDNTEVLKVLTETKDLGANYINNTSTTEPQGTQVTPITLSPLESSVKSYIISGSSSVEIFDRTGISKEKLHDILDILKTNRLIDGDLRIPPGPNLVYDYTQMGWQPENGYRWKEKTDPKNFDVISAAPGPNLVPSRKTPGKWMPEEGYTWANPDQENDISVIKRR